MKNPIYKDLFFSWGRPYKRRDLHKGVICHGNPLSAYNGLVSAERNRVGVREWSFSEEWRDPHFVWDRFLNLRHGIWTFGRDPRSGINI